MNNLITYNALELYISRINKIPILSLDEEFKLAINFIKNNDIKAAEKLVTSNLKFVVKIAYEYKNYGIKLLDLIQEGNIGLMHAVKKFDPYKGYRLISYAVWWIRAYIQNFVIKSWSLVKIGTTQTQRKLFFKLNQAKKKIEEISLKNPEFAEIAEKLNLKESEIKIMDIRLNNRDLSLDTFLNGENKNLSFLDTLSYEGENQEQSLIRKEQNLLVRINITNALEKLNKRELYIIQNRVMADEPLTLQDIGKKFNITRERARQIEKDALRKIKHLFLYKKKTVKLLTDK